MGIFATLLAAVSGASSDALPENAILIDVRSPDEFKSGHIEGAVSLPLESITNAIEQVANDKSIPVVVYCRSGARSTIARARLLQMGYSQVINGGSLHALSPRLKRKICR